MSDGIVFNIQRFTVHDGPGIRTELFLKGCPLRCEWCGNPESFRQTPQLGVYPSHCMGIEKCGDCISICPQGGEKVFKVEDNVVTGINRELCDDCLKCYKVCPTDTFKLWGKKMNVDEAMKAILADKEFYKENSGGVTISGGESLMQPEFVREVFKRCREEEIHTCLESALHVKTEVMKEVLEYTDMVITDIKHMDDDIHKKRTGVGNAKVLENIKVLSTYNIPVVLRIPVIPGFNDSAEAITAIGKFVAEELGDSVVQMQLLRFRPLGIEKYEALSLEYKMELTKERAEFEDEIRGFVEILKDMGINAFAGSTAKIEV